MKSLRLNNKYWRLQNLVLTHIYSITPKFELCQTLFPWARHVNLIAHTDGRVTDLHLSQITYYIQYSKYNNNWTLHAFQQ